MALGFDSYHRGLPVHPHILLPEGWVYLPSGQSRSKTEDAFLDLLDEQCFSAALQHAINNPPAPLSDSIRRPSAVFWLNLELNPSLKNDVVAVVLPIVGWKKTSVVRVPAGADGGAPCYVEMHHCMHSWRLTQLLNLRVIVAVPWPDLIPDHGQSNLPKGESSFLDLSNYSKRGIVVTVLPNLFEEATRDLLITLLISTLKGYRRESGQPLVSILAPDVASPPQPANELQLASLQLHVPKRRPNTTGGAPTTLTASQQWKTASPLPSVTAPPTSLTLATNLAECPLVASSQWVIKSPSVMGRVPCVKSLREVVVGFIGLTNDLTRNTALLIRNGLCMRVVYHQRHPLSCVEGIDFVADMTSFLQQSDVVILMDDCSDKRATLSKAIRSRSPVKHKSTKRSRYSIQDNDFRHFSASSIFISTSMVESFSFSTLLSALRNQTLAGAAFVVPLDGSLAAEDLESLCHLGNVIPVLPPSIAGCAPRFLRRQLAALVLQNLSEGLGFPPLVTPEISPPQPPPSSVLKSPVGKPFPPTRDSGARLNGRVQNLVTNILGAIRTQEGRIGGRGVTASFTNSEGTRTMSVR
uniref:D-isomer specific 2-hydroxyacid dehydrogenase NAD-binding domain-containing protein n=1 Tax=Mesocestoides corti TaxID=53468 RepID=A0A5K3FCF4_MESCO